MPGLWNPPTGGLSFPLNSTTCSITKTVDAATLKLWLRFKFKPAFCSERLPMPGCWVKVRFVYHSLLVNQTLETLFTRGTSFLLSTLLTIASFHSFLFTMAMLLMWFFFSKYLYFVCVCSVTHSCSTFCDPVNYSPPGSSVHGILQARKLEWLAISSSRGSSQGWDLRLCISSIGR